MTLLEFFIKYFEIIAYIFASLVCFSLGIIFGHLRTYEEDKMINDYKKIKIENETLKNTIKLIKGK